MQSMNLTKLSAAIILALSTAACSSGGSHSTTSTSPVITEQTAAEKAAAEKAAAEKAAAEKAAAEKAAAEKAAAEKAAAEKAAAEKAAAEKAAAEKAAAEKAEADRLAAEKAAAEKAEADRLAAEKAEADRLAAEKAAAEKAAAEKAAAEKAAAEKAAAEKAAAEKAEADRLAAEKAAAEKAEADRLAAEKAAAEKAAAEIEANRLVLLNNAKEAGLSDEQAAAYAETNKESDATTAQTALDTLIINIEKAEVAAAKGISDNTYPVGQITTRSTGTASSSINAYTKEISGSMLVYNQKYSVVLGNYTNTREYNNITGQTISNTSDLVLSTKGLKTTIDAIPTLGTATYNGKAFNGVNTNGILNYFVNFTDRLGSGSITGLGNTINLDQGSISGTGITSTAKQLTSTGTYSLDFYGKKAEEIAGKVIFNGKDTVGFGGTRSEISK